MKINKKKIDTIGAAAIWEATGKAAGMMTGHQEASGALGSEAESCRRDSPAPF
jgi:hypothetical protein